MIAGVDHVGVALGRRKFVRHVLDLAPWGLAGQLWDLRGMCFNSAKSYPMGVRSGAWRGGKKR